MKKSLICLALIGFINFSFSQIHQNNFDNYQLATVVINSPNYSYLQKVQDINTPVRVKKLENEVARYDIKTDPIYDLGFEENYKVIFEETKSKIVVTYDKHGSILTSFEKFEDVRLPKEVYASIANNYPGWAIVNDTYLVKYYQDKEKVHKIYKIEIAKDGTSKNLRINANGLLK
ncbi:MAG: hypothetical protein HKO01_09525 [Flaviramulus sp.]|nr:hypothetical protein [Flaviramulus sp.]NNC50761.1 hypothetical protein [Flaviramulus sp.]